jgi:hypothetical protein
MMACFETIKPKITSIAMRKIGRVYVFVRPICIRIEPCGTPWVTGRKLETVLINLMADGNQEGQV